MTERGDIIRPPRRGWDFARRERELFASASEIPTWRLANQARKFLAAVTHQLSHELPAPTVELIEELPAGQARQIALLDLAALIVRSTGSVIVLVSCGYEREAMAPARITVEAVLRGRQANDDPSGDVARRLLAGKRPGSLKSVARRYGQAGEIEFLDHFAHADLPSLMALNPKPPTPGVTDAERDIRPRRGVMRPASQLLQAAHETVSFSGVLAEGFGRPVEIPGWISGQLIHYRDNPLPAPL